MSDLYLNDKVREKAEQLVQQNVHYCVSSLIYQIANPDQRKHGRDRLSGFDVCEALGIDYDSELLPLLEVTDYEAAADYHIMHGMDADELRSYLDDQDVEYVAPVEEGDEIEGQVGVAEEDHLGTPIGVLQSLASEAAAEQGYEDFCNEFNLEPDRSEVFEHWIVDKWFATKLEEKGQPIARDFLGMTIWGRPTTGQAISMDGVVLEIANDILKED